MKLSTLLAHFWILGILAPCIRTEEEKCLGLPDIHPKKYAFLNDEPLNITLQVSERVTHKLITHIFYIFLKEVVGYAKVNFLPGEDYFSVEYTLDQMVAYHNSSVPKAMMNLEVWIPPDFDTLNMELIKECGSVIPSGRFGWFIPTALDAPIRKAYKHWSDDIREIHWSFFRDENNVKAFDLDKETLAKMDVEFAINKETKKYYCNEIYCTNGMYIPEQCKDKSCAVILTSNFNSTKFVVDDINEMKLYVKVYWLGNSLKNAIKYLTNEYETNPKKKKSIIILNWTPSDIILNETNYINVAFKNCERFSRRNDSKCKYEMHRLVKFAWKKVETIAESLYQALRRFELDQGDFNHLIKLYELYGDNKTVHQIACEWMKTRNATWKSWQSAIRPKLDIGGIFPISKSSYSGKEIMSAAWLAKNSINENQTILPDYDINLIVTDGECNAATVMKNFIDFIREETYQSLVGVLGPACSDTVEPLAGVSKHFRVMVISYSAEGASFSNREKYPYFFRTIGENKHYKHVYLDLFKKMGWKRVAALTEDGQKYTEYISLMQDEFDKNNIKFISNKKFPRERETDAMTRYLEDLKSKRARIIIADVVEEVARSVMCEAYRLKMTSAQGYVWFLPMRLNSPWYDTDYFNKNHKESVNCTTAQMIKAITGYFAMTHAFFAQDNEIMQENKTVGEWRREHVNISNYGSFAYDAVWTYALALDKLSKTDPEALSNIHSLNTTNKLVRLVEQTDFHGVSGRIKFRGGPSRFSVINLLEWYDNEMHVIGHFYPNLTDDQPEIFGGNLILNQTAIKWFTEDRKPPDDGTTDADCAIQGFAKFFNVGCQTAVIILNLICGAILCIIVTVVCLVMKRKYDRKVQEAQKRMMNSWGIPFDSNGQNDLDKWEVPRENVVINRKLGEGAFGMVYGGEANFPDSGWVAIAVKTLKMGSTTEEKLDFLSEADIMKRFDHKNIVRLLGVCTKEEPVYTIMEFMLYGDLKTFLLARRHLVNKSFDDNGEVSCKRLTSMALDVARALSYLAEMKYVHRDIASRNCLVNASRTVKLGDFGMTRANDYYKFNRKGMLPVRWMSPESLALGVFTPASDVWSYGVLLYEIITFGSFPFQGISNLQVLDLVKNGQTLDIPQGVKPQLEGLIKSCWQLDSKDRPPASQIVDFLANNPKLLAPCLDVPLSSVQLEDTDQLEVHLPNEFRKCSTASFKSSPTLLVNNGTTLSASIEKNTGKQLSSSAATSTLKAQRQPDSGISIPLENCCPKEPLLGTARSMSSILNFNKYAMHYKDADDDEDDFIGQSPPNGHVVTKV